MKIIALEEHFMTPDVRAALLALPPGQRDDQMDRQDPALLARLEDLSEGRLRQMDRVGVDVQVLSLSTPGVQSLEPAQAVTLARASNDLLAEAIRAHPDRFQGFATLPTPDPEAAACELERCVRELGFRGAMLNGRTRAQNMDDQAQWPIYAAAARLRAPLYIHPQVPVQAVKEAYYSGFDDPLSFTLASSGWGWHLETGVQALRLILSGVFDAHPDLQIILGHWGEMLTFYLKRVDSLSRVAGHLKLPVAEYVRRHVSVTPSGIFEPDYLRNSIETLGVERVLFSVDDPFIPVPDGGARRFLDEAPLAAEDREKIAHGNWERLTGER